MLNHWLRPVDLKQISVYDQLSRRQLGRRIFIYQDYLPNLADYHIAIVGVGEADTNAIRNALYSLDFPFRKMRIVDLGNVGNEDPSFIISLLSELLVSGLFPLVIANTAAPIHAQFKAYQSFQQMVNLVMVDEKIDFQPDRRKKKRGLINDLLKSKKPRLFNLGFIGHQSYYTPRSVLDNFDKLNFEYLRLGHLRPELEEAEPLIRDADMLSFNIAAMRSSEAPAQAAPTPSGLHIEEACTISRYAGMSDKLSSIGFYGFQTLHDQRDQTALFMAQMIWYFLDGYYNRKQDFPVSNEGLLEYIVEFKKLDYYLTFWKSPKSGRWWVQLPLRQQKKYQRHRLIPCSYKDYVLACKDELPQRLLNAYKRFTEKRKI
ncbi:MAG: arginase family protein [Bacteroidota bacterium]